MAIRDSAQSLDPPDPLDPPEPPAPPAAPTRLLAALAVVVLAVGTGLALLGAARVGISYDEPVHQARMNNWFEAGWYVPDDHFDTDGSPRPEVEPGRWHAYGAGFSLVGHAVAGLVGAEEWGSTNRSPDAYDARSVAVALIGLLAPAAVGFATAVATGRRLAGWWAAAATLAIPAWTGYSMFAVKDIPVATGWTLVTAGLVAALYRSPGRRRQLLIGLMCAVGVWFSFGTRPALWVPLAVGVAGFAVLVAVRWPAVRGNLLAVVSGLAAGAMAVAAVHYRNAAAPVTWLLSAVQTSADYPWTGTTLTAGELVPEKPPWWYLPAWVGGSMPLLLGALAVLGLVITGVAVFTHRGPGGRVRRRLGSDAAPVLLWGGQALLLPVAATLGNATMYAGLRQHLYVLPALAALAGFTAAWLLRTWDRRWLATGLLGVALVVPMAEQVPLYPYQYVYKNVLAGPVTEQWETDLELVSGREALTQVPAGEEAWCYRFPRRYSLCADNPQIGPFLAEQGSARDGPAGTDPDLVWVIGRRYRGGGPPPLCEERGTVTRWLRGEDVVMSYVLLCPRSVLDQE